jgi:hypothetical protein
MLDPSEGIGGAEDLADLSRELCASVWSPDDNDEIVARATAEARLSLAATAVAGEKPTWWAALQDAVLGGYDPDASPDDRMTIAQFANPMALAVAENLPGLIVTYETLGGPMTSGTFIYIWSDDPLEGRATIDAAFASAISTVEMMIANTRLLILSSAQRRSRGSPSPRRTTSERTPARVRTRAATRQRSPRRARRGRAAARTRTRILEHPAASGSRQLGHRRRVRPHLPRPRRHAHRLGRAQRRRTAAVGSAPLPRPRVSARPPAPDRIVMPTPRRRSPSRS